MLQGPADLPAVVLNPTACMGPRDRRPRDLCVVPLLLSGQVPAQVSQALNVIDVIDVRDVALAPACRGSGCGRGRR